MPHVAQWQQQSRGTRCSYQFWSSAKSRLIQAEHTLLSFCLVLVSVDNARAVDMRVSCWRCVIDLWLVDLLPEVVIVQDVDCWCWEKSYITSQHTDDNPCASMRNGRITWPFSSRCRVLGKWLFGMYLWRSFHSTLFARRQFCCHWSCSSSWRVRLPRCACITHDAVTTWMSPAGTWVLVWESRNDGVEVHICVSQST